MIDSNLINDNIFNRCVFGKASKEEMESNLKYYTDKEYYEKCIIIKELIELKYYTDNPKYQELEKITQIIENHINDLDDLIVIVGDLKYKDIDNVNKENINQILKNIDDVSDELIINILNSKKLRKEYLINIYNDITKIDIPPIKNKKLLENYRSSIINNLKKILDRTL